MTEVYNIRCVTIGARLLMQYDLTKVYIFVDVTVVAIYYYFSVIKNHYNIIII